MNVIVYARVSTENNSQQTSLSRQTEELKEYCKNNNFIIVEVIQEKN